MKQSEEKEIVFYVDETEFPITDTKEKVSYNYLAIAFTAIESNKVEKIAKGIQETLNSHIKDPFSGGNKNKLKKEKLHYNTADHELKNKCIEYLCNDNYNLKTYLGYGLLNKSDKCEYQKVYINLINKLMELVLSKKIYDDVTMIFKFEQNNKVDLQKIKEVLNQILKNLEYKNSRKPKEISKVSFISKNQECCLTIPDFMLGVFRGYCTKKEENKELPTFEKRKFEQLRDMYTTILDIDNNNRFNRKNPFKIPLEWF